MEFFGTFQQRPRSKLLLENEDVESAEHRRYAAAKG